jgi:rhodanese-related sulfurtransferase
VPPEETVSATNAYCIDPRELTTRVSEVTVVDVRTPGEYEAVHLPSSRNLPLDELEDHAGTIRAAIERGEQVVLLCRSGARAHRAQEKLVAAGLPELPIVEGGLLAWQQADGPVVQDVIRWDLERQVRFVAGSIVLLAVLVSLIWPSARFVAGFVGAGLVFASVTNTCAMGMLLTKLPYNRPRATADATA